MLSRKFKKGSIIALAVLLMVFSKPVTQNAQVTLSLLNINITSPLIMFDTVDFQVTVGVIGLTGPDTVTGDIFYYYLTDLMISTLQPPRIFEQDFVSEMVPHGFVDTIPIDIQPGEIKTTPVNLIILWPAMHIPEVDDTNSLSIFDDLIGFLGTQPNYPVQKDNILFPCPAIQYLNIRNEEIELIREIKIMSMTGSTVQIYQHGEFKNGTIILNEFATGQYLVEIHYFDHRVIRQKILKR